MKIALMGYARSGKDTVAELIGRKVSKINPLAFGTALKMMYHETFPLIPFLPKPRKGYERFGEAMRSFDENVWVRKLENRYKLLQYLSENNGNFIITDLRQPNEAAWCKANGFTIVYVHAHEEDRKARAAEDSEFMYVNPSEEQIWMINRDYTIYNIGTEAELEHEVKLLLQQMEEAQ
ncbi:AAA family ATPase [Paenibacillus sp. Soil724D2]|uniref:deoxynucleotide monophosphate kinase family protein n=1 Tax=Paenibacillus sp. (strain Soil724D2) TaxID=1736392 RepID=UPI000712638F|nr:AAA family ATPase [Paenibacillus sp. Soil724D2]KRE33459.1 hypothetical protein ASG85_14425 [Paenibacillus sp. Soil724D2]